MRSRVTFSKTAELVDRWGLRPYLLKLYEYIYYPSKAARYDLDVLKDYRSFRKQYVNILNEGDSRQAGTKRFLIVSLSPFYYRLKLEIILARTMHLRGYQPIFLTHKSLWVPNYPALYFKSARFGTTLFLEDYRQLSPAARKEVHHVTQRILADLPTIEELRDFRYRDVWVGEHILSSLSRTLHRGRIDITQPQATAFLRRILPAIMENVWVAEILLDAIRPDVVLFNDKGYANYGPIHDVCLARGINTLQFTWALEDDALILKRCTPETRRIHPNSLSPESWAWAQRMPWTVQRDQELQQYFRDLYSGRWFMTRRNQYGKKIKGRQEVQSQLGLDPTKKTVVVFSHILWDANLFFGEDLFSDFGEWLLETVRAAYANSAVNWIIKLHPGNIWKRIQENWNDDLDEVNLIQSQLGPLPTHVKLMYPDTDINTFSLFDVADYAITVRGTIGVEMSCFGIPVFTAGTGRYSGLGFTIDSASREEYLAKLSHIQDYPRLTPYQIELAKRYAYTLFILRPWRFQTMKSIYMPVEQANHPLSWNLVINARSCSEIAQAPDLQAFADWAEDNDRLDYLSVTPEVE